MTFSDQMDKIEEGQAVGSAVFVEEMEKPGGEWKAGRVENFKLAKEEKEERAKLWRARRKIEEMLPLSFKFVGFDAKNVEPEQVVNTVAKLSVGVDSVKLGKLRPNQKKRRIYNGWINFLGVGHCKRAIREIEEGKIPGMKLFKIGRTKDYKCGAITKKTKAPTYRRRPVLTCWGRSFGSRTESLLMMISKFMNFEVCFVFELLFLNRCILDKLFS